MAILRTICWALLFILKTEKRHSGTLYSSNNKNGCSYLGDILTIFPGHSQTKIKLQTYGALSVHYETITSQLTYTAEIN